MKKVVRKNRKLPHGAADPLPVEKTGTIDRDVSCATNGQESGSNTYNFRRVDQGSQRREIL